MAISSTLSMQKMFNERLDDEIRKRAAHIKYLTYMESYRAGEQAS